MSNPVKYRGIAFENGEDILIVPPLSTRQLEDFAEQLDRAGTPGTYTMKTLAPFLKENMIPLVQAALNRNYPDMTAEQVSEFVNTENWGALLAALLGNHTGKKVRVGEPFPEVLPGTPVVSAPRPLSPTSTGTTSEPESPVQPDGTGITS